MNYNKQYMCRDSVSSGAGDILGQLNQFTPFNRPVTVAGSVDCV